MFTALFASVAIIVGWSAVAAGAVSEIEKRKESYWISVAMALLACALAAAFFAGRFSI